MTPLRQLALKIRWGKVRLHCYICLLRFVLIYLCRFFPFPFVRASREGLWSVVGLLGNEPPSTASRDVSKNELAQTAHTCIKQQLTLKGFTKGFTKYLHTSTGICTHTHAHTHTHTHTTSTKLTPTRTHIHTQEAFMEAKMAFQTLSDDRARAEYDRKLRMVRRLERVNEHKGGRELQRR